MTAWPPHPFSPVDETPKQRHARHRAQHGRDLATLTAGDETGWWDEHGRPAPWPADFFDHDSRWRPETGNTPHSTNP